FFITGGASGLGAACAQRFAAAGAHVVLADVNVAAGEQLAALIGANARFVRTDVTDEASVQAAVDFVVNTFGGLQGAINCAGIGVVTIAPGIFDTPLLGGLPEPARVSLGQQVPFPPRLGRPDEYAALAQHIVENEMLNGEVIRLDGAIRMAPR